MTARLIGLGGKLRAGKDVVADRLVAEHGFVKIGMSDALHEAMLALDPWIHDGVRYSEAIARHGYVNTNGIYPEARALLQRLGTEVGRNMIGESVWVDIMAAKANQFMTQGRDVVVTGLRFPNEVRMAHALGGTTVYVDRPGLAGGGVHESETAVGATDFDLVLQNDSTIQHLHGLADQLIR